RSGRIAAKAGCDHRNCSVQVRVAELAYQMIAERDNTTVKVERQSSLLIVAKARVWVSEGWQVVITDAEGKTYAAAAFELLVGAGSLGLTPGLGGRRGDRPEMGRIKAVGVSGRLVLLRGVQRAIAIGPHLAAVAADDHGEIAGCPGVFGSREGNP